MHWIQKQTKHNIDYKQIANIYSQYIIQIQKNTTFLKYM